MVPSQGTLRHRAAAGWKGGVLECSRLFGLDRAGSSILESYPYVIWKPDAESFQGRCDGVRPSLIRMLLLSGECEEGCSNTLKTHGLPDPKQLDRSPTRQARYRLFGLTLASAFSFANRLVLSGTEP